MYGGDEFLSFITLGSSAPITSRLTSNSEPALMSYSGDKNNTTERVRFDVTSSPDGLTKVPKDILQGTFS